MIACPYNDVFNATGWLDRYERGEIDINKWGRQVNIGIDIHM